LTPYFIEFLINFYLFKIIFIKFDNFSSYFYFSSYLNIFTFFLFWSFIFIANFTKNFNLYS